MSAQAIAAPPCSCGRAGCRLAEGDPRHGTVNGYGNLKCGCGPCKAAVAEAVRCTRDRFRRLRLAGAMPDDAHGRATGYQLYGCDCDKCVTARRATRPASDHPRRPFVEMNTIDGPVPGSLAVASQNAAIKAAFVELAQGRRVRVAEMAPLAERFGRNVQRLRVAIENVNSDRSAIEADPELLDAALEASSERDVTIITMYLSGTETMQSIADTFGLSRERVRQIIRLVRSDRPPEPTDSTPWANAAAALREAGSVVVDLASRDRLAYLLGKGEYRSLAIDGEVLFLTVDAVRRLASIAPRSTRWNASS